MKAIVYDAPRQFKYKEVPEPEIQSDDVQEHHIARPQARRALGSDQPAGLCAAADPQRLIRTFIR